MRKPILTATFVLASLALAGVAETAAAQSGRFEITPMVGYRWGGTASSGGNTYIDEVSVKDNMSFGLTFEYQVHQNAAIEFLWSHQSTSLEASYLGNRPGGAVDIDSDLSIDTIQIGGLWQSGRNGDKVRGYFDLLIGASILSPDSPYDSLTRFSATIGGGAKFYFNDRIGARLGVRWMPVYINSSDSGYIYCDPYWGCYNYYNNNYLYQTDASAGLIIKF